MDGGLCKASTAAEIFAKLLGGANPAWSNKSFPGSLYSSIHLIQLYDVVQCIYEVKLYMLNIQRYFINTMYNVVQLYEVNRACMY